ncbi:unnamed protein product [Rotaria magnacalcarata]|uniref:Uncharacterized protein n=3 Tax=Rotaria magnacalcarata TaxID=392030 RepID=A0A8S2LJ41_9BILA|nr:unnamed protein product [Rotaria magnacalcarata]
MIDWLAIAVALVIIITLVGFFGFLAWKINMSDSLTMDDGSQVLDGINEKKKKDKTNNEQAKKKRKDQKKPKRENKDDEHQQRQKVKEPTPQTNEDSDDEREESEQELLKATLNNVETSSKARKRNKNKTATSAPTVAVQVEVKTKDEKVPSTTRAPPVTHPKSIVKDELESSKKQGKVIELPKKQIFPASLQQATKKTIQTQEQPFTVVGGNRNKTTTPPLQQQQQPQNKLQVNAVSSSVPVQPSSSSPIQHEQLIQRQQPTRKETPGPVIVVSTNTIPVKQQQPLPQKIPAKIADLIKVLPSSQVVVTELMSALDAFPLSTDELDIIMHKIANKQSVLRQDWKIKTNAMKRIKELTDELNEEKHRSNVLLKEKTEREREIQMLHVQLDSVQHKHESTNVHPQQRQQIQTIELQVKRLTEENIHLNHQLTQQISTPKLIQTGDSSNLQIQVLSDQIKKLSVDNGHLEKKVKSNELLAKEAQQEKENLTRYNEQLTHSLQNAEKDLKHVEEKHHKKINEMQTLHMNDINEYKSRIEKLEKDNEQLRHEEIVHVEPTAVTDIQTITLNNEEREQLEKEIQQLKQTIDLNQENERQSNDLKQKLIQEIEEYKNKIENSQIQYQSKENELQQEIEQLKQLNTQQQQQTNDNELAAKNTQLSILQAELDEAKSTVSQLEERQRQQREKHQQILTDLLPSDIRNQLSNDNQFFTIRMRRDEREVLSQRICNFYCDSANKSVKTTVNYFLKQNISRRTIYYILSKYLKYGITKALPRSSRSLKLSDKKLKNIVKSVNNRTGVSQRKIAKDSHVHQSTISRNLRRRTSIRIRKRRIAPKMDSDDQEKRPKRNCGKLYRKLLRGFDLILDDEKYFKLTGDNVNCNQFFYSTDPTTASTDIKFRKEKKFQAKIMIWMAVSSMGISNVYVYNSKQAINQDTYLNECINKRLLPFIEKHHQNGNYLFWSDLASAHYSKSVQERLSEKNVPFVICKDNPPNVPQVRPIETLWNLLEQKDFDQWLSSYQQIFESSQESQLRNIQEAVECKEEALLTELKSKDAALESIRNENDQLNGELQRLRNEIQRLQSAYDNSVSEISALKLQLDDRFLLAANTPSVDSDQSFEIIKHPLPSLAALVIDVRAEQVNELIRSGKEALEHQESITQQLDKHLNDMHPSGTGETHAHNADEPTVLSSTDQQS